MSSCAFLTRGVLSLLFFLLAVADAMAAEFCVVKAEEKKQSVEEFSKKTEEPTRQQLGLKAEKKLTTHTEEKVSCIRDDGGNAQLCGYTSLLFVCY